MQCYVTAEQATYIHNGTRWLAWDHLQRAFTTAIVWTGGGGVQGNASIDGIYQRRGDFVLAKMHAIWGSTTTAGGSAIALNLPFQVHSLYRSFGNGFTTLGGAGFPLFTRADNGATACYAYYTGGLFTNTVIGTFATGDEFSFDVEYNRAAYGADETAT